MRNLLGRGQMLLLMLVVSALLLPGAAMAQPEPDAEGTTPPRKAPSAALKKEIAEREAGLDREVKNEGSGFRIEEDPQGNPYVAGELIVSYERTTGPSKRAAVATTVAGARVVEDLPEIDAAVISVAEAKNERSERDRESDLGRTKRALEANPNVEAVDYNYVARPQQAVTNDPLVGQQWGLSRIKAPQAWNTATGEQTVVAVLDSGVQNGHPDLNGAILDEWDFFHNDPIAEDDGGGHATHVAGIAAAFTNNARGIAGTAPDAFIYDYKVCHGQTGCPIAAQIPAIQEATDMDADVINMSLAGYGRSIAHERAVNYAWNRGTVVVAAAGNDATNQPAYPAAFANAIAVTAVDFQNGDSDFSNYGTWVNVAAPGGELRGPLSAPRHQILSTYPTYLNSFGYTNLSGTSMASPFVAGVAALLASENLSAAQIRHRIETTATDLGPRGRDNLFGTGLVNARAAVTNRASSSAGSAEASPVPVTPSKM